MDWQTFFKKEANEPYARQLSAFLDYEYATQTIYPKRDHLFQAFALTPYQDVKVVIIGQDPYHQPHQAMGLSFSVAKGVKLPASLINIFKEVSADIQQPLDVSNGDLTGWAQQGVLLLNAILSVRDSYPLSHNHPSYQMFFQKTIAFLNKHPNHLVFMLWGNFAKSQAHLIDKKHLILTSVHPSPLSANRGGWFSNHHFSKANQFLIGQGQTPIDWQKHSSFR